MSLLILVLSSKDPPYDLLEKTQRETWDSVEVSSVTTKFYYAESLAHTSEATKHAFQAALEDSSWHWLFRTNASSYVDKKLLLEKALSLPDSGLYAGVSGNSFISGAGILLSRDLVVKLAHELPDGPVDVIDDVAIGRVLKGLVTVEIPRYDYYLNQFLRQFYRRTESEEDTIRAAMHIRCKAGDKDPRSKDIEAMQRVHAIKKVT